MKEIFERTGGSRKETGRMRAVFIREIGENFREIEENFREVEEPVLREEKAVFVCDGCGEGVHRGASCLAVRVPSGEVLRFCGECAGEALSMDGQLDRMNMRYFCGPAEDAESWASLGR